MQARSSDSGELVTWASVSADFAGADWPGPGDPEEIAVAQALPTGSASATVNGATVTAAGSLTTGNVLRVTGASALGYGAVNLASSNAVTGLLGAANGGYSGVAVPAGVCGHRLSLTTGVPVTTTDAIGASTLYLTPYTSERVSLRTGGVWTPYSVPQVSLALSGLTSGKLYDVFLYDNAGTPALVLSAAWTNDTTRADAISRVDGAWVLSSNNAKLHVGTIYATGTTTTEDSIAKRYVWNRYNQVPRTMYCAESTASWTYNAVVPNWQAANASSANALLYVCGDAGTYAEASVATLGSTASGSNQDCAVGVGVDSTTVSSAQGVNGGNALNSVLGSPAMPLRADYAGYPGLGAHKLYWLEAGAQMTFYGLNALVNRGAIFGKVWG